MVIPQWLINRYGDIEEMDVILQEELIGISTNEELKVQFKNGYQKFWLKIYLFNLLKKRNRLDITNRGDLRLNLTKLMPNIQKLLLQHQVHSLH
ncbi:uncharacterized protein TNCV_2516031 [Trichonephila clavipes]|nr:uncharacterized protein TNCV_2516031 [Trichonephila clavipes]